MEEQAKPPPQGKGMFTATSFPGSLSYPFSPLVSPWFFLFFVNFSPALHYLDRVQFEGRHLLFGEYLNIS